MQEFFWFFLGGFVYLLLDKITLFYTKIKFIHEIKVLSFKLIGYAYQQWVFTLATKYLLLEGDPDCDQERIKMLKNMDEAEFKEWKKETTYALINSIPPAYQPALEVKEWSDIMDHLEREHNRVLRINFAGVKNEKKKD